MIRRLAVQIRSSFIAVQIAMITVMVMTVASDTLNVPTSATVQKDTFVTITNSVSQKKIAQVLHKRHMNHSKQSWEKFLLKLKIEVLINDTVKIYITNNSFIEKMRFEPGDRAG